MLCLAKVCVRVSRVSHYSSNIVQSLVSPEQREDELDYADSETVSLVGSPHQHPSSPEYATRQQYRRSHSDQEEHLSGPAEANRNDGWFVRLFNRTKQHRDYHAIDES